MKVYAILIQSEDGVELLPNYFGTYKEALDEVKRKYPDWDDRFEDDGITVNEYPINKVEVEEGHKANGRLEGDPNLTELYIERGVNISIRILVKKPPPPPRHNATAAGGGYGYSRRRQSKRSTKKTRKHRIF